MSTPREQPATLGELIKLLQNYNPESAITFIAQTGEDEAIVLQLSWLNTGEQVFSSQSISVGSLVIALEAVRTIKLQE